MSEFESALDACRGLVAETESFDIDMFSRLRRFHDFNMDKTPVGPEPTDELEALGGYPPEVLRWVREVGRVTLNASCCFTPNVFLDAITDVPYFEAVIAPNLGVTREDVRFLGGDHGEGRWGLITKSGHIFFMEVDDDYGGQLPDACFECFTNWLRINFIIGLMEDHLERRDVDVYDGVPPGFSNTLLSLLSAIDHRLTRDAWPYELLYPLE